MAQAGAWTTQGVMHHSDIYFIQKTLLCALVLWAYTAHDMLILGQCIRLHGIVYIALGNKKVGTTFSHLLFYYQFIPQLLDLSSNVTLMGVVASAACGVQ